ncbi:hypothetical protein V1511DRAFT_497727 [Dipodascopsis uninucleata]
MSLSVPPELAGFEDESSLFQNSASQAVEAKEEQIDESSARSTTTVGLGFNSATVASMYPDNFNSTVAYLSNGASQGKAHTGRRGSIGDRSQTEEHFMTGDLSKSMSAYAEEDANTWDDGRGEIHGFGAGGHADSAEGVAVQAEAEDYENQSVDSRREDGKMPAVDTQHSADSDGESKQNGRPRLWESDDDDDITIDPTSRVGERNKLFANEIDPKQHITNEEVNKASLSTDIPVISDTAFSSGNSAYTSSTNMPSTYGNITQSHTATGISQNKPAHRVYYDPASYYQHEEIRAPQVPQKGQIEYVIRTRVTGMERSGKKPPLIKFDVYTNLPRFRTTHFRDIRRTYNEFSKLFTHLSSANPECFVPTLPPSTTAAGPGTDEDEYRTKVNFQKWLDRIMSDAILMRDEEVMYFIEADFGYSPITKKKAPATGIRRKALKQLQPPPDDCEELVSFRPLAKSFYVGTNDVHSKLAKVSKVRRSLGMAEIELGHRFSNMTALEFQSGMINMWKKLGKTVMSVGDIQAIKATSEMVTLGDGLMWMSNDAYVIKETLTNRQILIREMLSAQATSKNRHATAARLRSSATINPLRVDEALNALEEAKQVEAAITSKVNRSTHNLTKEKHEWFQNVESDMEAFIADYTRRMIDSERRTLAIWESIRLDIRAADGNGGLSRLGRRELPPIFRRQGAAHSQGPKGDSWSGDRKTAHGNGFLPAIQDDFQNDDFGHDGISEVDAKNAAALLAGSTF